MSTTEARTAPEVAEYRRQLRADLARELHDGPIQSLTEAVIRLEGYRAAASSVQMQTAISEVEQSVRVAVASLRNLIRNLRDEPPTTDLAARTREIASRFQKSTGVEVSVVAAPAWPDVLPADTAVNLIRIVHEAITNAVRHSSAEHVLVELRTGDDTLVVSVSDDGCGIPPEAPPGAGLIGMHERAALVGGRLVVRNRRPGTEIRVEVAAP